jgi:hypothetical protein
LQSSFPQRVQMAVGVVREEEAVRTKERRIAGAVLFILVVVPRPAGALELSGGMSLGGFLVGTIPRFAVSPNAGISWPKDSGFKVAVHDAFNLLPPINQSRLGVYNQTAISLGYATENGSFSAGPSLSIYSIPACGVILCGRVAGVAPGGNARASLYFDGPLGVSVSASVEWIGGSSLVLSGGVAAMVVAGPVLRWSSR